MSVFILILLVIFLFVVLYFVFFSKNYKSGFPTFKIPPMPEIKVEKDSETKELEIRKIESDNQLKIAVIDLLKIHYKITSNDIGINLSVEDIETLPTFNESFLKSFKELYTAIHKA